MNEANKIIINAVKALSELCDYLENNYEYAKKNDILRTIRMLNSWRSDY